MKIFLPILFTTIFGGIVSTILFAITKKNIFFDSFVSFVILSSIIGILLAILSIRKMLLFYGKKIKIKKTKFKYMNFFFHPKHMMNITFGWGLIVTLSTLFLNFSPNAIIILFTITSIFIVYDVALITFYATILTKQIIQEQMERQIS